MKILTFKKIIVGVFTLTLPLLAIALVISEDYTPTKIMGRSNLKSVKLLDIGMSRSEVISIMGASFNSESDKMYIYTTGDDSSPEIRIEFDDTNRIKQVTPHIFSKLIKD